MARLVTGLFKSKQMADGAAATLLQSGYREDEITMVLAHNGEHDTEASNEANNNAVTGLVAGGAAGGVFGGLLATAIAAGASLALPGVGLVIAGPLVFGLAGALVGGATGSLLGSLIGLGVPADRAAIYETGIRNGGIVLGVQARDETEADDLEQRLDQFGAEGVAQGQAATETV